LKDNRVNPVKIIGQKTYWTLEKRYIKIAKLFIAHEKFDPLTSSYGIIANTSAHSDYDILEHPMKDVRFGSAI
jgi:hypothetical protein